MRNRHLSPVIHIEPMQCHLAKSWKQKGTGEFSEPRTGNVLVIQPKELIWKFCNSSALSNLKRASQVRRSPSLEHRQEVAISRYFGQIGSDNVKRSKQESEIYGEAAIRSRKGGRRISVHSKSR